MAYTAYELPSPPRNKPSVPFILPSPESTMSSHPAPSFHRRAVPVDVFTKPTNSHHPPRKSVSRSVSSCGARQARGGAGSSSTRVADASIPHLREALSTLETKMASLMSERDALESRLEQAVRLQSPIQRLPSELLASVFTIGVLDMHEEDPLMLSNLMLVCRYWSDVATNTPLLWSRIVVGNHDSLEKARRRLSRAKSVPLDVSISFSPQMDDGGATMESLIRAMEMLHPSIPRWRSFRLSVPNRPQAHAALSRCRERAPMLELLQVKIHHSMQEDLYSSAPLPLFGGDIPSLRTCSFNSFNFGWDTGMVSGLRVLELGGYWNGYAPSVSIILTILRSCPDLEEFALRNMSDVDVDSIAMFERDSSGATATHNASSPNAISTSNSRHRSYSSQIVHLPRLTRLSLYYAGIHRARSILSQVALPSLERLELCYMDNVTPILKHLKRQSSFTSLPLRHLKIEVSLYSEMDLVGFLCRTSSLVSLELVDVEDSTSKLLRSLSTPSAPQSWTCPKLERLSLEGCTSFDWDALRTLVECRLPSTLSQSPSHSSTRPRNFLSIPTPPSPSNPAAGYSNSTTPTPLRHTSLHSSSHPPRSVPSHVNYPSHHPQPQPQQQQTQHNHGGMGNRSHSAPPKTTIPGVWPVRLKSVDVTRCHQVSKEMVQWLRMSVAEVKCDAKRPWGESTFL
ncbi:uncharacterized protein STEHIDRAFT_157574 [Stereum hirsutum FP-91666 SS1]|uniref:uncharacterized protein n=1 Tax=Stereum hirsutum (strain FP-91666) TaxID=721885 RepID=UPI0004449F6A|nr:uncharacterized protein STEHIDRAFT_157574 [Stereum hirsutum FP-91666 SS1]EIM86054.1 hypothetical protein STEHIDRAFT_157574 [Stereum hirsutum FP-91666 SS1]